MFKGDLRKSSPFRRRETRLDYQQGMAGNYAWALDLESRLGDPNNSSYSVCQLLFSNCITCKFVWELAPVKYITLPGGQKHDSL